MVERIHTADWLQVVDVTRIQGYQASVGGRRTERREVKTGEIVGGKKGIKGFLGKVKKRSPETTQTVFLLLPLLFLRAHNL